MTSCTRLAALAIAPVVLLGAGCSVASQLLATRSAAQARPAQVASASKANPATTAPSLEALPDDGIDNPTHRKYVGQIVFASKQIDAKAPDETQFFTEFYADELIYGRAFLPHSLQNEPVFANGFAEPERNLDGGYVVELTVDGRAHDALLERGDTPRDRRARTTQQVWPHPAPTDELTSATWVELVNGLAPGRHEIRVALWPQIGSMRGRTPIAAGTLTLHKAADTRVGIGQTARDLEAGMTDAALERDLLAAIRAYAQKQRWKEAIPDLTIESRAWETIVAKLTKYAVARRLAAWVHLEGGTTSACDVQRIVFEQKVDYDHAVGRVFVKEVGPRQAVDCVVSSQGPDRWAGRTRTRPSPSGAAGTIASAQTTASPPTKPATAAPARVAVVEPGREQAVSAADQPAPATRSMGPGHVSVGVGMAANALDATGIASYGNLGLHLGRVELGVGATLPLNALGYVRVNLLAGRFELSPMVTATALAEMDESTTFAFAGGMSLAYLLTTGRVRMGLRLDALLSYNPEPGRIAVPILGSTYVRF